MANIANGFLTINLNKNSRINKTIVEHIIQNLESNNLFIYAGECNGSYSEKNRTIDLIFNGKWSCDLCWEWFENEMSDKKNSKELMPEAKILLINSLISGGSYEYGAKYRDRVYKIEGSSKFKRYSHTKLKSSWPEIFGLISAYDLKNEESQTFGRDVEITLLEKDEKARYLFRVIGGVGELIVLINKRFQEVEFFSGNDYFKGHKSINKILKSLESGNLVHEEDPEEWFENAELVDDLIGENDEFFELIYN